MEQVVRCNDHPDKNAVRLCDGCSMPFCSDCLREDDIYSCSYYCKNCHPEHFKKNPVPEYEIPIDEKELKKVQNRIESTNLKATVIGGFVGLSLQFVLAFGILFVNLQDSEIIQITVYLMGIFIGPVIAGVKSINKTNAWKNGVRAVIFIVIIYLLMFYLSDYHLSQQGVTALDFLLAILLSLLIGAFGGFVGGKIKLKRDKV